MQENLVIVKEERVALLRKLCQLQGEIDPASFLAKSQMGSSSSPTSNSETLTPKKNVKKRNSIEIPGTYYLLSYFPNNNIKL